jgi:hypothetical protein
MQRVSKTALLVAVAFVIFLAPAVYADDPPAGTDPLSIRIAPPSGVTSQSEATRPTAALPSPAQASSASTRSQQTGPLSIRILPPSGLTSQSPVSDEPSLLDQFLLWLQIRIAPPIG